MVMLLSRTVSGEALFLFAPDGGVPDSSSHPFRVARFTNGTAGVLERGPIAVFEGGAFLGQGMVDPLPAGATATVPFALERGIAVDQDRKFDELGARLAKIENSELTVERDRVTQTKYRVRNGGDLAAKLLVKHPRIGGARLFAPPAGTEDNVGTGSALVPISIAAHATADLVVDERVNEAREADWLSPIADVAVKAYLADRQGGPRHRQAPFGRLGHARRHRDEDRRARQAPGCVERALGVDRGDAPQSPRHREEQDGGGAPPEADGAPRRRGVQARRLQPEDRRARLEALGADRSVQGVDPRREGAALAAPDRCR